MSKIMKYETILPTILIVIHALTAFVYLINLNFPKAVYWLAACALTIVVTYY